MRIMALMGTPFSAEQLQLIRKRAQELGFSVREMDAKRHYEADALKDCEILLGYFPRRLLREAKQLRWLHLPSAGADKYADCSLYGTQDFVLTNSSGAFGAAIAEQLVMGTLMLLRRQPQYTGQQEQHVWKRIGALRFLGESQVTVLGTGNLGSTFASYIRTMGAKVTGVNRTGRPAEFFDWVYPIAECMDAVRSADVVAACLPLTQETREIMDADFFAAMKQGSIFLNVGRGGTVAQKALIAALTTGHLAGAMLDVAEQEPMPPECPLWDMENVIITPHISGSDLDPFNRDKILNIFLSDLERYAKGDALHHIVDQKKGY